MSVNEIPRAGKSYEEAHPYDLLPPRTASGLEEAMSRALGVAETVKAFIPGYRWTLYALGSLGYGGYVPGWSDIDLDVIVSDPGELDLAKLSSEITEASNELNSDEIDVKLFDLDALIERNRSIDYGIANRVVMLLDSAKLLHGPDIRSRLPRPTHMELHDEARNIAEALTGKSDEWWNTRPVDDLAAIIALPARLYYTTAVGKVTSKQQALSYFLKSDAAGTYPPEAWTWATWAYLARFTADARKPPMSGLPMLRSAARSGLEWILRSL
ncbi:hypothetical protein ACIBAC_19300 [Streptomyces sp. NPDC051362]|uniref:hypothetical protein n=1 Tax=Streptomyces sp. NPDC051362 TaxID=3365651 RepID=UPI0037B3F9DB